MLFSGSEDPPLAMPHDTPLVGPPLTSRRNPIVARYRAAAHGDLEGLMLLDGAHLVADAVAAHVMLEHVVVAAEASAAAGIQPLLAQLSARGADIALASSSVMAAVSPLRSPSAIVAIARRPQADTTRVYAGSSPLLLIVNDVQDPGNMGAIIRVAEAAGAAGVLATGTSADPYGWKALRGSMGSTLRLPVARVDDVERAVAEVRANGCKVVATAPRGGRSVFDVDLKAPAAILIGGEGPGLPPAVLAAADERITVPMQSPVESLNAAVTAAIVVYEARRQRGVA
jgi:RNA methyltransferase, TrmH family